MNAVQQAEKALADAKKQEKDEYRAKELNSIKKEFEGKCFGSNTFDRSSAAAYRSAVYYEKFYLKDDEICVLEHNLSLSHFDSHYKKSMKQISYNRNINERKITGNDYNAFYNLYTGYSQFRKEISLQKFKELWDIAEEANLIIKQAFNGKLPDLRQEWITQGDHSSEGAIEKCISEMSIEMIDFKQFPEVHRCIEYHSLPMFDRRRWMPKQYVNPILTWHIRNLEEDCIGIFKTERVVEYNQRQIKIIKDFLSKL